MILEFSENNFDESENKKALISFKQSVMANQEPAFPSNPGKGALHNKASFVSWRSLVFIFGIELFWVFAFLPKDSFGNAGRGSPLFKVLAKLLAVISSVGNSLGHDFLGPSPSIRDGNSFENSWSQCDLSDIGGFNDMSQWYAILVNDYLPFGSLAFLGVADSRAPFLAGAKLASIIP